MDVVIAGGKNPDGNWLTQTFVFADEQGNRVDATVKDFDDISKLGYTYDRFEPVVSTIAAVAAPAAQPTMLAVLSTTSAVALGAEPVRVTLQPTGAPVPLDARVQALTPDRQLYLVFKNLGAEAPPGVLYHVYLELPSDASPSAAAA